jgi:hypothetical protein
MFFVQIFQEIGNSGNGEERNETSQECRSIQAYGISAKQPRANITKECET